MITQVIQYVKPGKPGGITTARKEKKRMEEAMLSTRDNFMRLLRKQEPEYVSEYDIWWGIMGGPTAFMAGRNPDGTGKDLWGVEWVQENNPTRSAMPKPGDFLLDDITKWRDVIKAPDFSNLDWAAMSEQDLKARNPEIPWGGGTTPGVGFFESLGAFMGFDMACISCAEEPEEVKALMDYLTEWSVDLAKKYVVHYKPDFGFMGDDIAHERNPFVSLETFKTLFAPAWRAFYAVFLEADIPVVHHNCGHFELFLDELVDMGVTAWDPVQSSNDIYGIKAKYGNNLALCELFDVRFWSDDVSEEEVRTTFKQHLDKMAPGGGYALFYLKPSENGYTEGEWQRGAWITDELLKHRFDYYK
jgi:hypothetical protein